MRFGRDTDEARLRRPPFLGIGARLMLKRERGFRRDVDGIRSAGGLLAIALKLAAHEPAQVQATVTANHSAAK